MTRYFDPETGLLDPTIYSSETIYQRELRTIFARSWLALGPADWVSEPGAFLTAMMGEIPVLAWCDNEGLIRVFLNRCLAGLGSLTELERGSARELTCSCHRRAYAPQMSRSTLLPEEIPKVALFIGLVFACLDEHANGLVEHLGELAWYWETIDFRAGGIEIYGTSALRSLQRANWKLPAETYSGDTYRELTLLKKTRELIPGPLIDPIEEGFQVRAGPGAMVLAVSSSNAENADAPRTALTPVMGTIFPSLSYDGRTGTFHIWQPRGPLEFEARVYCVVARNDPVEVKEQHRRYCQLLFGSAGVETGDQEAIWASITRASMGEIARGEPLTLHAGLGRERSSNLPGTIGALDSEMNQRAFYEWWQAGLQGDEAEIGSGYRNRLHVGLPTQWAVGGSVE